MKNTKKVLFAMILSAPLSMLGMEEFATSLSTPSTSRPASPKNLVQSELSPMVVATTSLPATPPVSPLTAIVAEINSMNAPRNNVVSGLLVCLEAPKSPKSDIQSVDTNAKAKKLGFATAILGLSTGFSFVAQAYDTSGVTHNPHFVKAQYAGIAATATTGAMATHEAYKANPGFVNNVVNNATTSANNVITSLKDLCTFSSGKSTVSAGGAAPAESVISTTCVHEDVE